ncbi:restriction endonuclease subunit S [Flavobacterium petrolei]|uniref:Restriction endonuclease subunit S n=1 Tax=Flavobacterium petrolei TaxID=2259594 RepID=A0A482TWR1_9FLAO|nr:restriction endonuclease subunit S [Flavobacterium petrolei]RYJ50990.1 restriction endonuclease subunit S [Flavobacterium petrolei]
MIEGYKDSELGFIPNDWKLIELRDVAKCTVGIATSTTHAYCDNGVILLRNQNIKEGKIALNDILYINPEFDELNKSKRLRENDIITVRTGYPGISAVVPKELDGSQSFTTLIIRLNEQKPLSNFLCYYINSEQGKTFFTNNQAGGGQQNVGAKTLERMKIPIPPIPEQQKIAEILSTVDDKIEVIDQQIIESQVLKKGLMQRLFTKGIGHTEFKDSPLGEIPKSWIVNEIELMEIELIDGDRGSNYPKSNDFNNVGHCLFLSAKNVTKNGFKFKDCQFVNEERDRLLRKGKLSRNDFVITTRGSVGHIALYDDSIPFEHVRLNSGMVILRDSKMNFKIQFLYQLLKSPIFKSQVEFITSGSAQPQLTIAGLKKLKLPIPSIDEQLIIGDILTTISEKLEVLSEKKTHYQELKEGLMQQLLTGKIRVKV